MKSIGRIFTVMQKEILHIMRDGAMLSIAFVAPFIFTMLMGYLYINHKVVELPVVVFDQDQSDISRLVVRSFNESERLQVTENVSTYADLKECIDSGRAQMGLIIPPNFKKNIKNTRGTEVGIIFNGTNILIMNTAANAASAIIQTISAGITMKVMQGYGISQKKSQQAISAVSFRSRVWYNPTASYLFFMILGVIGTVIQQLTLLGIALSIVKEKENGTWRQMMLSNINWYEVVIGKFLLFFMIYVMDAVLMYSIAISFFKVPMRGDIGLVLVTTLLFIVSVLILGMAISSITSNSVQAIQFSMILAVPSFLVSGFTWPSMSMPLAIQSFSKILPLTYFLEALRSEVLMGTGINKVVAGDLKAMVIFIIVCLPITLFAVNWKMDVID